MIDLLRHWAELAPEECSFKEIDPVHNGYRLVVSRILSRRGDEPFPVINAASDLSLVQEGMLLVLVGKALTRRDWRYQVGRYQYAQARSDRTSISAAFVFVYSPISKVFERRADVEAIALLSAYVEALKTVREVGS